MDLTKLRYADTHEWVNVEGDVGTLGITKFAVDQLTDVTYVEMPKVGAKFKVGDTFGVIESVKAASDLYAPVSGEIVAVNDKLVADPGMLNDDSYSKGWMVKLKLANPGDLERLLDKETYDAKCAGEHH